MNADAVGNGACRRVDLIAIVASVTVAVVSVRNGPPWPPSRG